MQNSQFDISWLPGSRAFVYQTDVLLSKEANQLSGRLFAVSVDADGTPGRPILVSGTNDMGVHRFEVAPIH